MACWFWPDTAEGHAPSPREETDPKTWGSPPYPHPKGLVTKGHRWNRPREEGTSQRVRMGKGGRWNEVERGRSIRPIDGLASNGWSARGSPTRGTMESTEPNLHRPCKDPTRVCVEGIFRPVHWLVLVRTKDHRDVKDLPPSNERCQESSTPNPSIALSISVPEQRSHRTHSSLCRRGLGTEARYHVDRSAFMPSIHADGRGGSRSTPSPRFPKHPLFSLGSRPPFHPSHGPLPFPFVPGWLRLERDGSLEIHPSIRVYPSSMKPDRWSKTTRETQLCEAPCAGVELDECLVEDSQDKMRTKQVDGRRWRKSDKENPSPGAKPHGSSPKDVWNDHWDGIGTPGTGSCRCCQPQSFASWPCKDAR